MKIYSMIRLFIRRRFITRKMMADGETGILDDEIKKILVFGNGQVLVFNRYDHQIGKYQGLLPGSREGQTHFVDLERLRKLAPNAEWEIFKYPI